MKKIEKKTQSKHAEINKVHPWNIAFGNHKNEVSYANNYNDTKEKVTLFNNVEDALQVFKEGKRLALGTTGEKGLVKTFFANPFGPMQLQNETNILLSRFFNQLFSNKALIGELFTGLGLEGCKDSPKFAAKQLLELIIG